MSDPESFFLITEEEWRLPPVPEDQNPYFEYIYV